MAAKKSFSQNISTEAINPFFSQQEEPVEEASATLDPFAELKEDAPEQGRHIPFKRIDPNSIASSHGQEKPAKEVRNRRVQLVLRPSDYASLEKIAHIKRKSTNGLINDLIVGLIEKEQDAISTYDSLYGDI